MMVAFEVEKDVLIYTRKIQKFQFLMNNPLKVE